MKKSFVLLEVLIGMSLLALCAFFFIHEPFRMLKREVEGFKNLEVNRLLEASLWEIEKSLEKEVKSLPKTAFQDKKNERTLKFPVKIGTHSFLIEKKYELWCSSDKADTADASLHHYLVFMHLEGTPKDKPTYKFYVKAKKL